MPRRSVVDFLALRRSIVGMLAMVILVSLGERMADKFLPIYLLAVGGAAGAIGSLGALKNLLGALYSLPAGYLADHWGSRRALLLFNLLTIIGYSIVILIPAWPAVLVGALFFVGWSAVSLPATMALVGRVLPQHKRTMGVAMHSLVRRFPMALGPLIGGILIDRLGRETGVRVGFGVALVMTIVAIVVQQRLIEPDPPPSPDAKSPDARLRPLRLLREMSPPLKHLLASDILIRFCEQIPEAFVIIWCMETIAHPVSATEFGVLTAIETTTAALIYLPVGHFADRLGKKPFVLTTFVFFSLFPLVLYQCNSFGMLIGAFILRGLKEFGDSTRKALILDLAPDHQRATTFGAYYLVRDLIVSMAAFAGIWLWQASPGTSFLTAFSCGVAGTIWFAIRGRNVAAPTRETAEAR